MTLDTVQELLSAIERLPEADRAVAQARVADAIDLPALEARAMLGLLALDVAGLLGDSLVGSAAGSAAQHPEAATRENNVLVLPDLETHLVSATA